MNLVILQGNLGADAELRQTRGDPVLSFSLATTEKWKDKAGDKQERTTWHSCSLWGKRGEALAQYLCKGDKVLVRGSIVTSKYEKDGVTHYATSIRVDDVEFAGSAGGAKRDGGGAPPARQQRQAPAQRGYGPDADFGRAPPDDFGGGGGFGGDDDISFLCDWNKHELPRPRSRNRP